MISNGIKRLLCRNGNESVVIMHIDINKLPESAFYYIRRCVSVGEYVICPEKSYVSGHQWEVVKDYASEIRTITCNELGDWHD